MKKIMAMLAVVGSAVLFVGCTSNAAKYDELAGHRYVLSSVNGIAVGQQTPPAIEFRSDVNSDAITVSGKMCNTFTGKAFYAKGFLKSNDLAMTRMICDDVQLNQLDGIVGKMFSQGVKATKSDETLTLRSLTDVLVYKQEDIKR